MPGSTADITGLNSNQIIINPAITAHAGDYSVTVNVDGCEVESPDYEVIIFETPTIVAANNGTDCIAQGTDVNLTATPSGNSTPYTYVWTGPNGFSSTDQNPVIPNAGSASSGTYTVLLTDFNGCTAEASTVVNVTTSPDEPVVSSNAPVCEGEQLVISTNAYAGTNVSYEWTGPLGSTTSGAYPDAPQIIIDLPTVAEGGIYTVQVTVDGCTSEESVGLTLAVNQSPTVAPTFSYTLDFDCSPSDLMLFANATLGTGTSETYQWSGPNGFASTDESPVITDVSELYNGSYTLIISDENGCSNVATLEVDGISDTVTQPIITGSPQTCEGGLITLSIPAYQGANVIYSWGIPGTLTNITGETSNQLTIFPANSNHNGGYTVTVLVDGCVVSSMVVYDVIVFENPTVVAANDGTECVTPMDDLNLTATPSGGSGVYTYQWSGPSGFVSTDQNPIVPNVSTASAGTYTVILTDENGCSAEASTIVDVTTAPDLPVIASSGSVCGGGTVLLEIPVYGGVDVTYEWTGPTGSTTGGDYPNANFIELNPATTAEDGNYTVQVMVDGCTSLVSEIYELIIHDLPTVTASNDGTECVAPTTDLNLTATPSGGSGNYTSQWIGPNGFTSVAQNPMMPNVSTASSGTYTVIITDENGCTAEASTVVDVTTSPDEPVVSSNSPVCEGEQLVISTNNYAGINVSYEWVGPLGTTTGGDYPDAPQIIIDLPTVADGGIYTVQVMVDGCETAISETLTINVNEMPTVAPTFNYALNPDCSPSDLMLFANSTAGTGTDLTYEWTGPAGFTSTEEDPIIVDVTEEYNGSYSLTISDENGCSSSMTLEVSGITDIITLPIITGSGQTCEGGQVVVERTCLSRS